MKKKLAVILGITLLLGSSIVVSASGQTRDGLKSYGRSYFTNKTPDVTSDDAIMDSADLIHIADRIDVLRELAR